MSACAHSIHNVGNGNENNANRLISLLVYEESYGASDLSEWGHVRLRQHVASKQNAASTQSSQHELAASALQSFNFPIRRAHPKHRMGLEGQSYRLLLTYDARTIPRDACDCGEVDGCSWGTVR